MSTKHLPVILTRSHAHAEFPNTVQVGMMAYSNSSPADIDVWFDDIRFTREAQI